MFAHVQSIALRDLIVSTMFPCHQESMIWFIAWLNFLQNGKFMNFLGPHEIDDDCNIIFCFSGMGNSLLFLTSSTIVPMHFTTNKYLALSVVNSGYNIGALCSPFLMKTVLSDLGFKYTCLILASLSFLASIAGVFLFPTRNKAKRLSIPIEKNGIAKKDDAENAGYGESTNDGATGNEVSSVEDCTNYSAKIASASTENGTEEGFTQNINGPGKGVILKVDIHELNIEMHEMMNGEMSVAPQQTEESSSDPHTTERASLPVAPQQTEESFSNTHTTEGASLSVAPQQTEESFSNTHTTEGASLPVAPQQTEESSSDPHTTEGASLPVAPQQTEESSSDPHTTEGASLSVAPQQTEESSSDPHTTEAASLSVAPQQTEESSSDPHTTEAASLSVAPQQTEESSSDPHTTEAASLPVAPQQTEESSSDTHTTEGASLPAARTTADGLTSAYCNQAFIPEQTRNEDNTHGNAVVKPVEKIAETELFHHENAAPAQDESPSDNDSQKDLTDIDGKQEEKRMCTRTKDGHQEENTQSEKALPVQTSTIRHCTCSSLKILRSPIFLAVTFALIGNGIGRSIVSGYEVALTTEIGIPATNIAIMLSVVAGSGVFTSPVMGAILSIHALKPYVKHLYAAACLSNGILILLYGVINSFAGLLTMGIIKQVMKNVIGGQISGILTDLFGIENLLDYRVILSVFEGCANLAGPFIAGKWIRRSRYQQIFTSSTFHC